MFNRVISCDFLNNGQMITVDKLNIEFETKKTITSDVNTCTVKIYMCSDTLTQNIMQSKTINLMAGYQDENNVSTLYIGDIAECVDIFDRTTRILTVSAGDGLKPIKETVVSKSYDVGTESTNVIKDLMKTFGIPTDLKGLKDLKNKIFTNGFSFNGFTASAMDNLAKELDFNWSIQNGEVTITPTANANNSTLVLSPNTGLKGSPKKIKIPITQNGVSKDVDGYELNCFLLPKAIPADVVAVSSREIGQNKLFKIINITHVGGRYTDFNSMLEVISYA